MKFGSINEFTRFLETRIAAVEAAQHAGMQAAGDMLVQHARDMIGTEAEEWAPLAFSTVDEKQRLGFTGRISATDPLYRTGELRVSISCAVEPPRLVLYSDDPVAIWQECGTPTIPPRPFISATMHTLHPDAARLIASYEMGAAMGLGRPLSE